MQILVDPYPPFLGLVYLRETIHARSQEGWKNGQFISFYKLINETVGKGWHKDLYGLKLLEPFAKDRGFLDRWRETQEASKSRLAAHIKETMSIIVDPTSMFDAQVKRLHEYKRQHLNALHIFSLYCQIKSGTIKDLVPRTFLFGGKAALSYTDGEAHHQVDMPVGELVNNDPRW